MQEDGIFVSVQLLINNILVIMLAERIAELRDLTEAKILGKSSNLLFDLFDPEKCREIDERAKTDPGIKKQRKAILNGLSGNAASASKGHEEAFTLYNEICVFDMLAQKDKTVRFVPKSDTPTPDFSITASSGQPVNLELKTLSFKGSDINFRRIEKDIKATDAQKPDWLYQSAIGISQEEMERITRRTFIEHISEKVREHYEKKAVKQVNYNGNPGILLIDTVLLEQTFMLFLQDTLPGYHHNCYYSGCLWNAVFGKQGDKIIQCTMPAANMKHDPIPPGGEAFNGNGVLVVAKSLEAIIFIVRTVHDKNKLKTIGFSRSGLVQPDVAESLSILCEYRNDEKNSNPSNICLDITKTYLPTVEKRIEMAEAFANY